MWREQKVHLPYFLKMLRWYNILEIDRYTNTRICIRNTMGDMVACFIHDKCSNSTADSKNIKSKHLSKISPRTDKYSMSTTLHAAHCALKTLLPSGFHGTVPAVCAWARGGAERGPRGPRAVQRNDWGGGGSGKQLNKNVSAVATA